MHLVYWLAGGMYRCELTGRWDSFLCIVWQVACIFVSWLAGGMHFCVLDGRWYTFVYCLACNFVYWLAGDMHLCVLSGRWHAFLCVGWQMAYICVLAGR